MPPIADIRSDRRYSGDMSRSDAIAQQMRACFHELERSKEFGRERMWLTGYVTGQPKQLLRLAEDLASAGWSNLSGHDFGTIHPKIEVNANADDAIAAAIGLLRLADKHGTEIGLLDADTSADVFQSRCVTLYESP